MNAQENIINIAQLAGKRLKPSRDVTTVEHDNIPYFQIVNSNTVKGYNYEKHDNAPRMKFFENVLPMVLNKLKGLDMNGLYFNVELHDTYSYLKSYTSSSYNNCLVWSKRKTDEFVILLPDLYHLNNFNGKLKYRDTLDWNNKIDKIGFWGTTTGDIDPLKNQRIQTCLWSIPYRKTIDFYITNIAQMTAKDIFIKIPDFQSIYSTYKTDEEMLKYKFLLDIPGNTCSWDRVPFIMNSKSLLFKAPCQDMCFYYPFMKSGTHYIDVDNSYILSTMEYYKNNPKEAEMIIENANYFVSSYLQQSSAYLYMSTLFQESIYWNAA